MSETIVAAAAGVAAAIGDTAFGEIPRLSSPPWSDPRPATDLGTVHRPLGSVPAASALPRPPRA